mmetsp:Transcript_93435/g.285915  ORF Transcript_93435/g.285915 Transcript_93435/m.285915 type:complete len:240 (+) Transcript_93435:640-1359(+)
MREGRALNDVTHGVQGDPVGIASVDIPIQVSLAHEAEMALPPIFPTFDVFGFGLAQDLTVDRERDGLVGRRLRLLLHLHDVLREGADLESPPLLQPALGLPPDSANFAGQEVLQPRIPDARIDLRPVLGHLERDTRVLGAGAREALRRRRGTPGEKVRDQLLVWPAPTARSGGAQRRVQWVLNRDLEHELALRNDERHVRLGVPDVGRTHDGKLYRLETAANGRHLDGRLEKTILGLLR